MEINHNTKNAEQIDIGYRKEFEGIVNPTRILIDPTLTKQGYAADAKVTGQVVERAEEAADRAESYAIHQPIIGDNGNWYIWNGEQYVDTGSPSKPKYAGPYESVEDLPETGIEGIIYLVNAESDAETDVYDEYIWVDDAYEKLGSHVDLTGYATELWVSLNFVVKLISGVGGYEDTHTGNIDFRVVPLDPDTGDSANAKFELNLSNQDLDDHDIYCISKIKADNSEIKLLSDLQYHDDHVYGLLTLTQGTVRISAHNEYETFTDSSLNLNSNGLSITANSFTFNNENVATEDFVAASYLPLAGGNMTGNIAFPNNKTLGLKSGVSNIIKGTAYTASLSGVEVHIGDYNPNGATQGDRIFLHSFLPIKRVSGTNSFDILDTLNTSANPTLSGNESRLNGLKINGTSYKLDYAQASWFSGTPPTSENTKIVSATNKHLLLQSGQGGNVNISSDDGYVKLYTEVSAVESASVELSGPVVNVEGETIYLARSSTEDNPEGSAIYIDFDNSINIYPGNDKYNEGSDVYIGSEFGGNIYIAQDSGNVEIGNTYNGYAVSLISYAGELNDENRHFQLGLCEDANAIDEGAYLALYNHNSNYLAGLKLGSNGIFSLNTCGFSLCASDDYDYSNPYGIWMDDTGVFEITASIALLNGVNIATQDYVDTAVTNVINTPI